MLLVERGDRQWLLPIDRDAIAIGRSPNNHVSIQDSQLAPRHLRIIPLGEEIWAKDMGSPAGFLVNGNWKREALLRSGDEIAVGELRASVLIEERALPPAPVTQVEIPEAPEPPPTPVRRRSSLSVPKKRVSAGPIVLAAVLLLGIGAVIWIKISSRLESEQRTKAAWQAVERARNYLREKSPAKARDSLRGIAASDPEIAAQVAGIEREIASQETEARKPSGREEGDEYYERYLLPMFKSNEILSDIRWENVAWRRSEEFLRRFPKHPLTNVVQARRDRFAAGSKEAPAPRLEEVQIDAQLLTQAKRPHFAMARERVVNFLRDNLGGADDLAGRDLLKKIDAQSEAYLAKELTAARELWNGGDRDKALARFDRLIAEIGREDLAEQALDAKRKLQGQ